MTAPVDSSLELSGNDPLSDGIKELQRTEPSPTPTLNCQGRPNVSMKSWMMVISALKGRTQSLEHLWGAQNSWYTQAHFGDRTGEAECALAIITVLHQTHAWAAWAARASHGVSLCQYVLTQEVANTVICQIWAGNTLAPTGATHLHGPPATSLQTTVPLLESYLQLPNLPI